MRNFLKRSATAVAAVLIGSTAFAMTPGFAASGGVQIAQVERGERGDRGDRGDRRPRGERGGGERGGGARIDGGARTEGGRSGGAMVQERVIRRDGGAVQFDRRTIVRRDMAPDRRVYPGERYDRRYRVRPGYGAPFVYLGGPRVIVRGYGPGWCRGLHRGWHQAPRIGWHGGQHFGLYRC